MSKMKKQIRLTPEQYEFALTILKKRKKMTAMKLCNACNSSRGSNAHWKKHGVTGSTVVVIQKLMSGEDWIKVLSYVKGGDTIDEWDLKRSIAYKKRQKEKENAIL